MSADIKIIYKILISWDKPKPSADLINEYERITGMKYMLVTWQRSLKKLNLALAKVGMPALGALIFNEKENDLGDLFWGTAPNIPLTGSQEKWQSILKTIKAYPWPSELPTS
ncbi:hypothetical protein [Aliivibrio fischeri]|uniref:hypothetical protein n=1 Tax=Aliivibrio fischeri TaxID=668 RepID=UPI00084C0525|nr:hypothetical protein [Aliivibrio fischeri]MUJ28007.1 hypothetical protein [Aliivibrio fischeri]OED55515.1 hypothetical protein BEI47_14835 [Aliivibrio fischeri]